MKGSGRGHFSDPRVHGRSEDPQHQPGHRNKLIKHTGRNAANAKEEEATVSMKTSTRQVDGVTIVDMSGRITLGEGSVVLRDAIRDLLGKGQKKILLNLGDVTYIDSSGIGELVSAFTAVRRPGRRTQTAEPDQESPRPAADHQALHRLRHEGRRSCSQSKRSASNQGGTAGELLLACRSVPMPRISWSCWPPSACSTTSTSSTMPC